MKNINDELKLSAKDRYRSQVLRLHWKAPQHNTMHPVSFVIHFASVYKSIIMKYKMFVETEQILYPKKK
jgi:hypothetical protein